MKIRGCIVGGTVLMLMLFACGPQRPADINLEQAHNRATQYILAPGLGTIGLISQGAMHVYFHDNEDGHWYVDESSHFDLPEKNQGIFAAGMGTIGMVKDQAIQFYRLDSQNRWKREVVFDFELPGNYDRLFAMKMPWDLGVIGIETGGVVSFYYFDEGWQQDQTATFVVPEGITGYYAMGDMVIAVTDHQKLGLYYLGPEGGWEFMDEDAFVLLLPEACEGIVPLDHRFIAILLDGGLHFYQLDLTHDRWVSLPNLYFELPW